MVRVLTVCGSLQRGSANRAALDVVIAALRSRGADVDDFDGLAALPPMDVAHCTVRGKAAREEGVDSLMAKEWAAGAEAKRGQSLP